jgi:hypothetical protein
VALRGARRAGAGAFEAGGGWPHRVQDEAPAAGRHHAPALHRPGTVTACDVPGASTSGKSHEVPRCLRSKRATAAISTYRKDRRPVGGRGREQSGRRGPLKGSP